MIKRKVNLFLFLLLLLTAGNILAQGRIAGTVKDSISGESLYGANVLVLGTSIGAAVDIEGEFVVNNVPVGNQKIRVSYIGYVTKTIDVNVVDGKILQLDVDLKQEIFESDEVVISAQAMGQVAAINQQLSSNTIINVVSEEKIEELPDANAAEAIGRLPGVSLLRSGGEANKVILRGLSDKYTYVTVDGVKIPSTDAEARGVDLSAVSQNNLAGIELYKALTPDKEADAIAGSVNLVTKKAPDERKIKFNLRGGYNDLMSSAEQYNFSGKYSERFFDNVLGVQLSGNAERAIRSKEEYNLGWSQNVGATKDDYYINNLSLLFTDEIRTRNGGNLIFDYDLPETYGNIKLNTSYSRTKRDYLTHERNYPVEGGGGGNVGAVSYEYRDRERTIDLLSTAITGNNDIFGVHINWGASFAESRGDSPYDYEMDFAESSSGGVAGMMAGIPNLKDNPERIIDYAYNNFNVASLAEAYYRYQENYEKDRGLYADFSKDFNFGDMLSVTFKTGARYRSKTRTNNAGEYYSPYYLGFWKSYTRNDLGGISEKDLSGSSFTDFWGKYINNNSRFVTFKEFLGETPESRDLYDKYALYPLIDRDKLREWYDLNKDGVSQNGEVPEYPFNPASEATNYDITESVTSGYFMGTFNVGQKLIVIAGLRAEREDNDYISKYSPNQIGGFPVPVGSSRDTSASYSETIWLPNLQLNYKVNDWLNIRAAAYKALARPDFNMRLNTYFAWDPASVSGRNQLVVGNTKLKTAEAWNFEVNTSFFGNEFGLVTVSAFYKQIDNMYHMLSGFTTRGNTLLSSLDIDWESIYQNNYELTVPYNSTDPSKVWGFEFEHQMNTTFLPGFLKNFVLSYNFSLVKSETTLISSGTDTTYTQVITPNPFTGLPDTTYNPEYSTYRTDRKQPLENQPEFFGNLSLGYDIGNLSARVSLFHQAEYTRSYSASGRSDRKIAAYTRIDMSMKYQLLDNLALLLNVNNLNNIFEDDIQENKEYNYEILRSSERYGTTMDFGVRLEL